MVPVPAGRQADPGALKLVDGHLHGTAQVGLDAADYVHLAAGEQPRLAHATFPAGVYPGEPVDMPAETDHLDLVGQQPPDRHYNCLGTGTAPLDHPAHGRMADPAGKHADCLQLFGLEPLA